MDTLRNLTTPLRKHDRLGDGTMPNTYTIGSRVPMNTQVTRPFSAMTIEDLLDRLLECDRLTVSQQWLPAMRIQFQKMVSLLNDAGQVKLESSINQIALTNDLKHFSEEIRLITASYRKVVESAESLAERDTKACHEHLKELEVQVDKALERMGAKDKEIEDQDRKITELRHTIHEIARVLGTFIQNNIPSWVETINEPRTQEVLQLISDYARGGDDDSTSYARIPEATLAQYGRELRETQALVHSHRKVMYGQKAMIEDQSNSLDDYTNKYEKAINMVKERDHEILLLLQQNDKLTQQLEETQAALAGIKKYSAETASMAQRCEELRGNMESLKIAHMLEIDQREAEITNLRQKLGSAREEVFARRADVKNVLSQAQTILHTPDLHAIPSSRGGHTSKALRFLGMERDKEKFKRGALPSSHSMMGLSTSDPRYSSKEVASTICQHTQHHNPSLERHLRVCTTPNTPIDNPKASSDSVLTSPGFRPRSDSLGTAQHHGTLASPINTQKSLPDPPATSSPQPSSVVALAEASRSFESPTEAQIASDYFKHSILGQTSARRVLSNIPEASVHSPPKAGNHKGKHVEDDNASDDSVASSDREAYRKSICALNMLNSSTGLPYSETETDIESIIRGGRPPSVQGYHDSHDQYDREEAIHTGVARVLHLRPGNSDLRGALRDRAPDSGRQERFRESFVSDGEGYRSEDSEPKTVAQLYHQGRRHIRG